MPRTYQIEYLKELTSFGIGYEISNTKQPDMQKIIIMLSHNGHEEYLISI